MNWNPRAMIHRVHGLPRHLRDLGHYLGELSSRVRESIAEAVGNTVAGAVRDSLTRIWDRPAHREPPTRRREPEIDPYDWTEPLTEEQWLQEQRLAEDDRPAAQPAVEEPVVTKTQLLALAMKAAGWYLQRRGSWLGALGLSLLVGGVALVGGPLALAGLGLVEAATQAVALNHVLCVGAGALAIV